MKCTSSSSLMFGQQHCWAMQIFRQRPGWLAYRPQSKHHWGHGKLPSDHGNTPDAHVGIQPIRIKVGFSYFSRVSSSYFLQYCASFDTAFLVVSDGLWGFCWKQLPLLSQMRETANYRNKKLWGIWLWTQNRHRRAYSRRVEVNFDRV